MSYLVYTVNVTPEGHLRPHFEEISEEDALTNKGLQNVPDGTFKIPAVGDIVCGHYSAVSWSMAISFIGLSYRGINFNVAQPGCGFHRLIRAGNDTY